MEHESTSDFFFFLNQKSKSIPGNQPECVTEPPLAGREALQWLLENRSRAKGSGNGLHVGCPKVCHKVEKP